MHDSRQHNEAAALGASTNGADARTWHVRTLMRSRRAFMRRQHALRRACDAIFGDPFKTR